MTAGASHILEAADMDSLIQALIQAGYSVVGPTVRDRTIVYDRLGSADDLPRGWTADQEKGSYRLRQREDQAFFGYASALDAWKKFLHPPRQKLWEATLGSDGMTFTPPAQENPPMAFLGVRSCDLHAIAIQDRVFCTGGKGNQGTPGTNQGTPNTCYQARRKGAFIVAVNCTAEAATCFCAAMGTGPRVSLPHDLSMTEILDGDAHYFALTAGSDAGEQILRSLPVTDARAAQLQQQDTLLEETASRIGRGPRAIESADLQELLYRNYDSPQWDDVAGRCLSCANCTMVCPTCFCSSVEDVTDVGGDHAERWERWDSCFTQDFTYLHGGAVRQSTRSRYRQWMTHKLATWIDQFGTSGCVGCGRCIAWCPVGIDITEEVSAIRVLEIQGGE